MAVKQEGVSVAPDLADLARLILILLVRRKLGRQPLLSATFHFADFEV
jgi:hypothetical protein